MTGKIVLFSILCGVVAVSAEVEEFASAKTSAMEWNLPDQSPRGLALRLAAGDAGEGYQVHDGFWSGTLEKDAPILLEVYLFEGNDYRFSAANTDPESHLVLSIFDTWGYAASGDYSDGRSYSTAGISVLRTGRYFVRLVMTEGDKADACVVY
ncbi:MAG: hypothetical protein EBY32_19850, partial [Proteobacteria bacterium]|nr:hypothetical protein [Pseudomonadota bacterium]